MSLFICSKCSCIESSSLGWYWSRNSIRLVLPLDMKEFEIGKALCSECLPAEAHFEDGSGMGIGKGKWHGKFPKQSVEDFLKEDGEDFYERRGDYLIYIGNK